MPDGTPMHSDRGAFDAANYPEEHTNDTDTATTSLHHTLGTEANQAAAGDHTHAGGHDPATVADTTTINLSITGQEISGAVLPAGIKLDDLGTPDNNTDLDATSTYHGLLPKLSGDSGDVLKGDGTWGAAPGGSGHTIQDEGTPLTARANLNFVGASVEVTDDSGNDATVVTITGGAPGGGTDILMVQVFS